MTMASDLFSLPFDCIWPLLLPPIYPGTRGAVSLDDECPFGCCDARAKVLEPQERVSRIATPAVHALSLCPSCIVCLSTVAVYVFLPPCREHCVISPHFSAPFSQSCS